MRCRDRRPRRSGIFDQQQNMDMIGHNYIAFHGKVWVELVQLIEILPGDLPVVEQFDLWTVQEAGPYIKLFQLKCAGVELVVGALLGDQVFVGAPLDDPSVIQHHDAVGIADGA